MRSLAEAFQDASDLLALDPEELAKIILRVLPAAWDSGCPQTLYGFIDYQLSGQHKSFIGNHNPFEVRQAVVEGWMVLERAGLLVPASSGLNPGRLVLSRRAQQLKDDQDWGRFLLARALPSRLLHPSIRDEVWSMYLRGLYDAPVFQAFKEVEVAVRSACGWPADNDHLGVKLMRKAFAPGKGPLSDDTAEAGEQQGVCDLFAGAIGSYKNPQSHRRVEVASPEEAAELLMLASQLLRIIDARVAARGAPAS